MTLCNGTENSGGGEMWQVEVSISQFVIMNTVQTLSLTANKHCGDVKRACAL
jgi:hypothetical protein